MCHCIRGLWKLPSCLLSLLLETVLKELISQLGVQASRSYPRLTSSACLAQTPQHSHPPTRPASPPAPVVSTGVKDQPKSPLLTRECLLLLHSGDTG